jgi:hypothetical protein
LIAMLEKFVQQTKFIPICEFGKTENFNYAKKNVVTIFVKIHGKKCVGTFSNFTVISHIFAEISKNLP